MARMRLRRAFGDLSAGGASLVKEDLCNLRRSVSADPIIEEIIDSNLQRLDVRVVDGETVAGEEPSAWNSECPAVQSEIIILELRRPIRRESPFDAHTHQPAAIGVVAVGSERCTGRHVGDDEVVGADPTTAGFAIKEQVITRHAESGSHGCDPPVARSHLDYSIDARNNNPVPRIVVVPSPVEVRFNAENDVAELVVRSEE